MCGAEGSFKISSRLATLFLAPFFACGPLLLAICGIYLGSCYFSALRGSSGHCAAFAWATQKLESSRDEEISIHRPNVSMRPPSPLHRIDRRTI